MVRITFKGVYNQSKFYIIVFRDQFKGHITIAGILQKFPIVGYFLLAYYLVHFPEVGKYAILDLDHKLGLEPDFGSKVLDLVKIPLLHLVEICYGAPYLLNRSIKCMRYNNWRIRTFHTKCICHYKIRIFTVFLPFDSAQGDTETT